jgi:hypothetical protein
MAYDAGAHLLHVVTHFFGQRTGQGPVVIRGLKLFVFSGDHLVKVHRQIRNGGFRTKCMKRKDKRRSNIEKEKTLRPCSAAK